MGLWTLNPKCFPIQSARELGKARQKEEAAYSQIIGKGSQQLQTVWEKVCAAAPAEGLRSTLLFMVTRITGKFYIKH